MWFDNHCHLTNPKLDVDAAVAAAGAAGVSRLLTVGVTVDDSRQSLAVAVDRPNVWATAGVHPHDAEAGIDGLEELLAHPKVVGVGETGLDFHYDYSPRPAQAEVFRRQIALAHRHAKALVIHTRLAWEETFAILDAEGTPARTVFHCFTGGPDEMTQCLARGASVSFSGIVTFPSAAADVAEAARLAPLGSILVETDSPYLAPVPLRGKRNEPANVAVVGRFVAELRGQSDSLVAQATTTNALALYGIAPDPAPMTEPGR